MTPEERFWAKVEKTSGCWNWTARCHPKGYGAFWNGKGNIPAHRFSWELHYGPIPEGMLVCHQCDNPACIRPDHLFLGTQADNIRDSVSKGRMSLGELNPSSKLTAEDVIEIRRSYSAEELNQSELALAYDITPTSIHFIVNRKTWKHLKEKA